MTRTAVVFLVLLRMAIGWHFLVEGYQKIPEKHLAAVGLKGAGKTFSSSGYFREAPGPLGDAVRRLEGDPDDEALSRLVPLPVPEDEDPATYKPQMRTPPRLKQDWQDYLKKFSNFYDLDKGQRDRAEALREQAEANVVGWLSYVPPDDQAVRDKDKRYETYTSEQTRSYPTGEIKRRMSMAERVAEYRKKVADLRDAAGRKMWLFGKDVEGARLRAAKAEVGLLRLGLLADLDKQTKAYQESLDKVLTKEQKAEGTLAEAKEEGLVGPDGTRSPGWWGRLVAGVREKGFVGTIDLVTPWALTAIGACLLLGLFSRLSAFLAAGFLLMTYLAVPSWPWLPAPPASEGSYLFVNKNVVEMLALFALAALPTGRWFGADGILYGVGRLFSRRKAAPVTVYNTSTPMRRP